MLAPPIMMDYLSQLSGVTSTNPHQLPSLAITPQQQMKHTITLDKNSLKAPGRHSTGPSEVRNQDNAIETDKERLKQSLLDNLKGGGDISNKSSGDAFPYQQARQATAPLPMQMQKSRDSNPPGRSKGSAISDGNISFKDLAKFQVQQVL